MKLLRKALAIAIILLLCGVPTLLAKLMDAHWLATTVMSLWWSCYVMVDFLEKILTWGFEEYER
jgi:hypothetical protein